MARRAIEVARERIGLVRVAVFLKSDESCRMRGTWGTDLDGRVVDEHGIAFEGWPGEGEFHERAAARGVHWTVVENAPLVVHLPEETRVVGRGWVCSTPIGLGENFLGAMFNDAGLSGAPVDDAKQTECALLCALLAHALQTVPKGRDGTDAPRSGSPIVRRAVRLLEADPSLTSEQLGTTLGLSASRMARVFKAELGVSIVDYRNRLRLSRFETLVEEQPDSLLAAALRAGFGSYAQFHRVYSAERGSAPRRRPRRPPSH
jgi:AraC-like DNA-binding protein